MDKTIDNREVFRIFDHTLLDVTATTDDITRLCGEAVKYGVAAVCVPPCYVKQASQFIGKSSINVCTVIGYPNGYATTDTKIFECKNAIKNGADELEIYANIGYIKKRQYNKMQAELAALGKISKNKILKLIIDTSILNSDEQIAVCTIATSVQIDYISITSKAGFDELVTVLKRLKDGLGERARIKITGDITSLGQADALYSAGAARVGESKVLRHLEDASFVNNSIAAECSKIEPIAEPAPDIQPESEPEMQSEESVVDASGDEESEESAGIDIKAADEAVIDENKDPCEPEAEE